MKRLHVVKAVAAIGLLLIAAAAGAQELRFIEVSPDNKGFVYTGTTEPFALIGFNYDHDERGRLLEDYWHDEWPKVEADFAEMRKLGANVVRIHLQTAKFLDAADKPNEKSLAQLAKLVALAERERLYLDLTGLGCYHKQDVPAWYDELSEEDRWAAQAVFWKGVASRVAKSPAVFCYDLMNEPVSPAGKRKEKDWLGPAFGDKHFVQVISLDAAGRPRPEIAKTWIDYLVDAIREVDKRHLITVGLVDWSLDRPGLTSGFVPEKVAGKLDFLCVHLYPQKDKVDEAIETLKGFSIGKPVVIEETFPLKCSMEEMESFLDRSREHSAGWISFYWGATPEELAEKRAKTFGEAIQREWLKVFVRRAKK